MAKWFKWKCDQCGYIYSGAGKESALMNGPTTPLECKECQTIYDYVLDKWKFDVAVSLLKDSEPIPDVKCNACLKVSLYIWNIRKKNCPKKKCDGRLRKIDDEVIMAD